MSRNTVLWAVERLQFEGYLAARVGDGTYVSEQTAGFRSETSPNGSACLKTPVGEGYRSSWAKA